MTYTDDAGRTWTVIDYRLEGRKRKRLELGDTRAEGRAFVPFGWEGDVLLYHHGPVTYRTTEPKILADQLRHAKPSTASPGERMDVR